VVVKNFLRRWSTIEITSENALLFEEHLMGVRAIASEEELRLLDGLDRSSSREDFALRYR
jgi:hypothetical protein